MILLIEKVCPTCGIQYAGPEGFFNARSEARVAEGEDFWYCLNGHRLSFGETALDKALRERDLARQQIARAEEEAAKAVRQRDEAQKALKETISRVGAGCCPCCKRNFVNLARHMKTKHPGVSPLIGKRRLP